MRAQAYLSCTQAVLRIAHPRLMLAHPQLRLKQQLLRSRDGNGKCHENIPVWVDLFQVPCVSGWHNFHRLIRPDFVPGLNALF